MHANIISIIVCPSAPFLPIGLTKVTTRETSSAKKSKGLYLFEVPLSKESGYDGDDHIDSCKLASRVSLRKKEGKKRNKRDVRYTTKIEPKGKKCKEMKYDARLVKHIISTKQKSIKNNNNWNHTKWWIEWARQGDRSERRMTENLIFKQPKLQRERERQEREKRELTFENEIKNIQSLFPSKQDKTTNRGKLTNRRQGSTHIYSRTRHTRQDIAHGNYKDEVDGNEKEH